MDSNEKRLKLAHRNAANLKNNLVKERVKFPLTNIQWYTNTE